MGFLDDVTLAMNRNSESAGRAAERMRLSNHMSELLQQRQQFAAQLGASLYESTKDNAEFRNGREALYDAIAACDNERVACQAQIEEIDKIEQAATIAATVYTCAVCGAPIGGSDLFCSGCGSSAEKAMPQVAAFVNSMNAPATNGAKCPSCGASMAEGDAFCMNCGAKVG